MKTFTLEELKNSMQSAPELIRTIITNESTALIIADIGTEAHLHIDQVGLLSNLTTATLLGLSEPQHFLEKLTETGITDSTARQIVQEVNEKIFAPLQQQMRTPGKPTAKQVAEPGEQISLQSTNPTQSVNSTPNQPANLPGAFPLPPQIARPRAKLLEDHEEPSFSINRIPSPSTTSKMSAPPASPAMPKASPAPKPLVKEYAADPYREPIDEENT